MKKKRKALPAIMPVAAIVSAAAVTMLLMTAAPAFLAIPAQASEITEEEETIGAETKVTSSVETGAVDITLSQGYLDEYGNRVDGSVARQLMPGKEMSLIPTVSNEGNDCYVRVRLTSVVYGEDGEAAELASPFDVSDIYGVADNWKLAGDYLYYTEVLSHGASADVFEGFTVPQSVGNAYAGKTCEVAIVAEAVQSDFFTADFTSDNPWGDLTTEACIREGYDYESLRVTQDVEISVTYTGGAENFVVVPDDFFAHFAAMLSGGSYTGTAAIENTYTEETQLFFKTGVVEAGNDLLEQMQIKIVQVQKDGSEKTLYEGAYNSESLQEYLSLGLYGEDEGCSIRFTITVPEELDNAYTLQSGKIDWYFKAASYIPATAAAPDPLASDEPAYTTVTVSDSTELPAETDSGTANDSRAATGGTTGSGSAKTGDTANICQHVIAAAISALILAAVAFAAKRRKGRSSR